MDDKKKAEPYAHGADMWREYAAEYGIITARIICSRYLDLQKNTANPEEREFCRQLREEMMMANNMKEVPLYLHGDRYAAYNGESAVLAESDRVNRLCAGDIDRAVYASEYGDGSHYFKYALAALSDQYGLERVKLVLAAEAKWLGVFNRGVSKDTFQWAHEMKLNEHFYGGFHLRTRPNVLDELISELWKEENIMQNKISSMETVDQIRGQFPEGTRVELISEENPFIDLKPGDKGTVSAVDSEGTVSVDWDKGISYALVYGEDSYKMAENELDRNAQPTGAVTYTLGELIEKMAPQHMNDQTVMRECISGLGTYATHKVKENSFSSEVEKTRELIKKLVPYWGLDDGENAKPLDDFLTAFDEEVHEALFVAAVSGDTIQTCEHVINGLYRYGQELIAAQGSDAMGEILDMSDLISDVAEYFKYGEHYPDKIDTVSQMVNNLRSEVKDMLEDYALPGQAVDGDNVHGYTVKQAVLFNNNSGFAFAHDVSAPSPFVTWQITNDNGKLSYETGKYYSTEEKALVNYITRATDYKDFYKLSEKSLPERPEPEKPLIRFIDSEYRNLFQIPDGESIRVTYPPGDGREPAERSCKFLDELHFSTHPGSTTYHACEFAEAMERIGAIYEPVTQLQNIQLVPFTAGEDKYYLPNRDETNTSVGIISGNFGRDGDRYHDNWTNKGGGEYTPEIQSELQSAIYALRQDLLKDHNTMLAYCQSHPEAKLPGNGDYSVYGFKLETETRQYFIRCFAEQDSRFSIYAYADKPSPVLEQTADIIPVTVQDGKYTSVLKTIEKAKAGHKPPRKEKSPEQQKAANKNKTSKKNKNEEL